MYLPTNSFRVIHYSFHKDLIYLKLMLERNLLSTVDGDSIFVYVQVLNNSQNFMICNEFEI